LTNLLLYKMTVEKVMT